MIAQPDDEERYANELAGTMVLTEQSDPALDVFSDRVSMADIARQALTDLVGRQTRSHSDRNGSEGWSQEWRR